MAAEKLTLARPYAKAAFGYAMQNNCLDDWSVLLDNFAKISSDIKIVKIIKNPVYAGERLVNFLISFIGNNQNKYFSNFIKIIASYGRLDLLPEIAAEYNNLKLKHNKAAEVLVKSAVEITSEQKEIIKTALVKKLNTKVNLNFTIDPSLIGGLIIKTGDLVIDSSVRGQLGRLLKQLAA